MMLWVRRARLIVIIMAVIFFGAWWAWNIQNSAEENEKAKAAGFYNSADWTEAKSHGLTSQAALGNWRNAEVIKEATRQAQQRVTDDYAGKNNDDISVRACLAAQRVIEAQLLPRIAKLPSCGWEADKYHVQMSRDRRTVTVVGQVDAQNVFGAMLRNTFSVEFSRDVGSSDLHLKNVTIF